MCITEGTTIMLLSTKLFAALKFSALKLALVKTAVAVGLGVLAWGTSVSYSQTPLSLQGGEAQNLAQATPNGASSKTEKQKPSLTTEKQTQLNNMWPRAIHSTVTPQKNWGQTPIRSSHYKKHSVSRPYSLASSHFIPSKSAHPSSQ